MRTLSTAATSSTRTETHQRLRILLVDDEPKILNLLARLLQNHRTTRISSGEIALVALARGERFDVVISDNDMPGASGLHVLACAADRLPNSLRIMFSGTPPEILADLVTAGVINHYVEKPGFVQVAHLCDQAGDAERN